MLTCCVSAVSLTPCRTSHQELVCVLFLSFPSGCWSPSAAQSPTLCLKILCRSQGVWWRLHIQRNSEVLSSQLLLWCPLPCFQRRSDAHVVQLLSFMRARSAFLFEGLNWLNWCLTLFATPCSETDLQSPECNINPAVTSIKWWLGLPNSFPPRCFWKQLTWLINN